MEETQLAHATMNNKAMKHETVNCVCLSMSIISHIPNKTILMHFFFCVRIGDGTLLYGFNTTKKTGFLFLL